MIHVHVRVYMYIYTCVRVYMYMYMCIGIHIYICVCTHTHTPSSFICSLEVRPLMLRPIRQVTRTSGPLNDCCCLGVGISNKPDCPQSVLLP